MIDIAGTVLVGIAGTVLAVGPPTYVARSDELEGVRCIRAVEGGAFAPERALAAVRKVLRRRTITNQQGTFHLTPGRYEIVDIGRLVPQGDHAARRYYSDAMRRRCGNAIAENTWLVRVNLSAAQLVLPPQPFLVTPTRRGWRVTYRP